MSDDTVSDDPVSEPTYTLHQYPERLVVVGLPPGSDVPAWAESSSLFSISAAATETTVVCAGRSVPKKVKQEGPFTAFAVEGPIDRAVTGVLHALLGPLAEARISVVALSAFSTDWILVPTNQADTAAEEWRRRGHTVVPAPVVTARKG